MDASNPNIDYRWEDINESGEFEEASLVPFVRSWLPLSENPIITPKKRTVQPGDAFEATVFTNSKPDRRVSALFLFVK